MTGWALVETHPIQGRTFQRPLDASEQAFFWHGCFNGTTDNLHFVMLHLLNPAQDGRLFTQTNIVNAWLSTKRRYPLAAAAVQLLSAGEGNNVSPNPYFVIREHDLTVLRPNEIVFGQVACADEVQERITGVLDGPRPLSDELLVQLYVFRETSPDRTDILHLMTLIAHCVTDGMANRTLMRCLLDTLARGGDPDSEPAQIPLEDRLAMVVPAEECVPAHLRLLSPARRRWRRAIAAVVFRMRMAGSQGGHTLPCQHTHFTPFTPARSGFVSVTLTEAQTSAVVTNCRFYGLTFGNTYLALSQVAMTRVLYRRYLRGELSEEDWEFRKRQPYRWLGPLNERPHLDKEWFKMGGGGEFMTSIKGIFCQLPFMTLNETERHRRHGNDPSNDVPPFSDLLKFDRFLHRAKLARKQMEAFLSHPLFFEITQILMLAFGRYTRFLALKWTEHVESAGITGTQGNPSDSDEDPMPVDMVFAHGGSTLGDLDLIFPTEYPLPPSHPLSPFSPDSHPAKAGYAVPPPAVQVDTTPKIVVEDSVTQLHVHPMQLYLGALTSGRRLRTYVFYDRNVYEDGIVKEWLDEVKAAMLWYLGQAHRSSGDSGVQIVK